MAKYAINKEGSEALNQLANNLLINANNVVEMNRQLEQVTISIYEELGIYGDEIIGIIQRNRQILNNNREDIINLAQQVKKQAQDVENLVAMGLGEVSNTNNNSGSYTVSNGVQGGLVRPDYGVSSGTYKDICHSLEKKNVEHNVIEKFGYERTTGDIVERLGGGDKTQGSCSSLAFAYAGNKAGYDVLDFRDGESRKFFSSNSSISMIAGLPGVNSKIVSGFDDVECADRLLSEMEPGKEYYLATGQHASIVRLNNGHYEYLELQSATDNGWHLLYDARLYDRFGCGLNRIEYPNFLIDVDSLSQCNEFLDILGYINTAECNQRKGESGHVR